VAADGQGARLNYLFAPNPNHPLWGEWSKRNFPIQGEQNFVSLGYVGLALAIVGVAFTKWRYTRLFAMMGIVALALSIIICSESDEQPTFSNSAGKSSYLSIKNWLLY
jgi:hypothetical protein